MRVLLFGLHPLRKYLIIFLLYQVVTMNSQSRVFIGNYGPFGWKNGKVENEKWVPQKKKKKLKYEWKSGRIEKILISFICVWLEVVGRVEKVEKWNFFLIDWEEKKNDDRKCGLYKFIFMPSHKTL